MAAAYHAAGRTGTATFEVFVRSLPDRAQLPGRLRTRRISSTPFEAWRFNEADIDYLRSLGQFAEDFLRPSHRARIQR